MTLPNAYDWKERDAGQGKWTMGRRQRPMTGRPDGAAVTSTRHAVQHWSDTSSRWVPLIRLWRGMVLVRQHGNMGSMSCELLWCQLPRGWVRGFLKSDVTTHSAACRCRVTAPGRIACCRAWRGSLWSMFEVLTRGGPISVLQVRPVRDVYPAMRTFRPAVPFLVTCESDFTEWSVILNIR